MLAFQLGLSLEEFEILTHEGESSGLYSPDNWRSKYLWNVAKLLPDCTAL
jgi:hypothetical protein